MKKIWMSERIGKLTKYYSIQFDEIRITTILQGGLPVFLIFATSCKIFRLEAFIPFLKC